jgi:hypothetical protein
MKSVLQQWVTELPFMQQTVLLSAIRGPDGLGKNHSVRETIRWYRRCVLLSAFTGNPINDMYEAGGGSFMGPVSVTRSSDKVIKSYFEHFDELPLHFHMHMLEAAEIVGYKHPVDSIRMFWNEFYNKGVSVLHFYPETHEQLDKRLANKIK